MKVLYFLAFLLAAVNAAPQTLLLRAAAAPAVALGNQGKYHAQDELGQYSFGYYEPNQVRSESKDFAGITRGSYSYVAPNGQIITNNYVADRNGFRSSLAPSNGPVRPLEGEVTVAAVPQLGVKIAPVATAVIPTPTVKVSSVPAATPLVSVVPQKAVSIAAIPTAPLVAEHRIAAAPVVAATQPIGLYGYHSVPFSPYAYAYGY